MRVSPPIALLNGFPLQRNHSPAPSRLQSPKDLDLPPPLTFLHPTYPGLHPGFTEPILALHLGHSVLGLPPPRDLLEHLTPRVPSTQASPQPLPSPCSPAWGPLSFSHPVYHRLILLLRWLICFLLICLLPTQEYLHKFAGLGAKGKRRCPRSNIRKSSVWPRVSAQASHLGARPSLPITPGRSTY